MHDQPTPYAVTTAPIATAPVDSRARAFAIALWASALLIAVGVLTKHWFVSERGDGGLGLTGIEVCRGDACQSISWGDVPKAPADLQAFAWLGLLGGIASAGFSVFAGVMIGTGRAARIPMKIVNVVFGLSAFATTMFAMRILTEMSRGLTMSWSGALTLAGLLVAAGIVKASTKP